MHQTEYVPIIIWEVEDEIFFFFSFTLSSHYDEIYENCNCSKRAQYLLKEWQNEMHFLMKYIFLRNLKETNVMCMFCYGK